MKTLKVLTTIFLLFYMAVTLSAQFGFFKDDPYKRRLEKGIQLYKKKHFYEAYKQFNHNFNSGRFNHPLSTTNQLMLIKSLFKMGNYSQAQTLIRDFYRRYPHSQYRDDLELLRCEVLLKKQEFILAGNNLVRLLESEPDQKVTERCYRILEKVIDNFFLPEKLTLLRDNTSNNQVYTFLSLKLAAKLYREGRISDARDELQSISTLVVQTPWQKHYQQLLNLLSTEAKQGITIGIILPLSGPYSDTGIEILKGIQLAIKKRQPDYPYSIKTLVLDNQGDPILTIKQMEFLARNPEVISILGPLTSENTITAAAIASRYRIPLISPTATRSQITSLSDFVFQANPPLHVRGNALALFCTRVLNLKKFAILSPADQYGKELSDHFASTIDLYGGQLLAEEWYLGSAENLIAQFRRIREVGLEEMRKIQMLSDTLTIQWDSSTNLPFVDYEFLHPEFDFENQNDDEKEEKIDSSKIVINSIDALLLPIHAGEIEYAASQFASHYLNMAVLGDGNWYDLKQLNKHPRYVDGLYFVSDYFLDPGDSTIILLDSLNQTLNNTPLNRFTLYGYDLFQLILTGIQQKKPTRNHLLQFLNQPVLYRGTIRNFFFVGSNRGINNAVYILQYKNKKIIPICVIYNDVLELINSPAGNE